jgi:hypothetical protein
MYQALPSPPPFPPLCDDILRHRKQRGILAFSRIYRQDRWLAAAKVSKEKHSKTSLAHRDPKDIGARAKYDSTRSLQGSMVAAAWDGLNLLYPSRPRIASSHASHPASAPSWLLCNFLRQFRASFSKRRTITFGSTPDLQPEHHKSEVGGQMQRCVNASKSVAARALARFRKAAAKYWDVTTCEMDWWILNN